MPGPVATLQPLDVLLVRHAEAVEVGTRGFADDDRPLTEAGKYAAQQLAAELDAFGLTAIYTSPYLRAVQTVHALAVRRGLKVQLLTDLRERRLSRTPLNDWRSTLEQAWTDADFAPPRGETGRDALRRGVATLDLMRSRHPDGGRIVLGSHGNLISLMLQALEPGVDSAFHIAMPTPAVYRLTHDGLRWRVMGGHGFTSLADD